MVLDDYGEYRQRVAAHLRAAAEHSTTKGIKARLVAEAEQRKGERRNGSLFVPS
jgi:hypothetical protein